MDKINELAQELVTGNTQSNEGMIDILGKYVENASDYVGEGIDKGADLVTSVIDQATNLIDNPLPENPLNIDLVTVVSEIAEKVADETKNFSPGVEDLLSKIFN